MKKFALTTLAILGVILGTANLIAPAHAAEVSLFPPCENGQG